MGRNGRTLGGRDESPRGRTLGVPVAAVALTLIIAGPAPGASPPGAISPGERPSGASASGAISHASSEAAPHARSGPAWRPPWDFGPELGPDPISEPPSRLLSEGLSTQPPSPRPEATWSGQVGVDAGSVWSAKDGWLGSLHTRGSLTLRDQGAWKIEVLGSFRVREGDAGTGGNGGPSWKDLAVEEGHQGLSSFRVSRTYDRVGSLRAGRYAPEAVPSIGQIDAVEAELRPSDALRAGVLVGLRPRPDRDVSSERPVAATYVGTEFRAREALRYSGTLGLIVTGYDGRPDRLACLVSQRADVGTGLTLHAGTELDLNGAVDGGRADGVQLSAQRVEAVTPICRLLTLRAGFDHRKAPDTREERDANPSASEERYREGSLRRWVGGSHALPWSLRLDEEISLRDEVGSEERIEDWQVSLQRTGIPGLPGASVGVSLRSIEGLDSGRVGCRVSGDFRLLESRLSLRPSVGLEMGDAGGEREGARMRDLSLQARWSVREGLQVFASASHAFDASEVRPVVELGVEWWF